MTSDAHGCPSLWATLDEAAAAFARWVERNTFRHLYQEYYELRKIAEPLAEAFGDFKDIASVLGATRTRIQALARQAQSMSEAVEELEAREQATASAVEALQAYVEERQALPWWKRWGH